MYSIYRLDVLLFTDSSLSSGGGGSSDDSMYSRTGALPVLGGSGSGAVLSAALSYRRNVSRDSSADSDDAPPGKITCRRRRCLRRCDVMISNYLKMIVDL